MAEDHGTVIGQDTHIKGEMRIEKTARILGSFEGSIASKGEVQIGDTAKCKAAIEAQNVIVDGAIQGNVTAGQRLTLNTKARIAGDLVATTLVVAEGATLQGHCRVGPDAAKGGGAKPQGEAKPSVEVPDKSKSPTR
ncbi:MAG: polymer-forming cytoskeletal protein [Planctomycetota bacterium]